MTYAAISEMTLHWQAGRATARAAMKVAHRSRSSLHTTPSSSQNEVHLGLSLEGRASANVKTKTEKVVV
jgi:hypothetical protein